MNEQIIAHLRKLATEMESGEVILLNATDTINFDTKIEIVEGREARTKLPGKPRCELKVQYEIGG